MGRALAKTVPERLLSAIERGVFFFAPGEPYRSIQNRSFCVIISRHCCFGETKNKNAFSRRNYDVSARARYYGLFVFRKKYCVLYEHGFGHGNNNRVICLRRGFRRSQKRTVCFVLRNPKRFFLRGQIRRYTNGVNVFGSSGGGAVYRLSRQRHFVRLDFEKF